MRKEKEDVRRLLQAALCCSTVFAAAPALACFTVLSEHDRVVYHAASPPFDMSRPIHETLPAVFPGGHLVFDLRTDCTRGASDALQDPPSTRALTGAEDVVVRVLSGPERLTPDGSAAASSVTMSVYASATRTAAAEARN